MEQHRPGDVELVNLTVHPKPLGTLVDYRCRFRVGPVTLPFQQASSEVMLKLLTWDHSVKSKDINGKVTPPPRSPPPLTCHIDSVTSEEPTQEREWALLVKNQPRGGNEQG